MPRKGDKKGYYISCETCGKTAYKTKTEYNKAKHHFCCNECAQIYRHNQTHETRTCEICGKKFEVPNRSSQRFCSIVCQGKWQSTQTGDKNPRTRRIECDCDCCGKTIKIIPSNYKRFENHFCGDACRQRWYSEVFSQNEDWKEESRFRATRILSSRKINTNTKPQIIVNEILDNMGISYINEYNFNYYAMDNYLNNHNLAIEVMGDYWHCSPLKYKKDKISDLQRRRIRMDKAKHTYILKYYNLQILYLWESDIVTNPSLCEELISQYVNKNGALSNYHSFNYHIDDSGIYLNDEIIYPYQDM